VVINGSAGNNIDAIKTAIAAYITTNSTSPQNAWVGILPDVFTKLEFMVIPRWFKYAIPPSAMNTGLYSSVMDASEVKTYLNSFINSYPAGWVDAHTELLPLVYKSLAIAVVPGNLNTPQYANLISNISDYMPIPSTSPDFNRMSAATQAWVSMITNMVTVAETATTNAGVPLSMAKVIRNGKFYVSMTHNNVDYLVYAKSNLN
jgi:hypothetical protein